MASNPVANTITSRGYSWADVPEVYCNIDAPRPAVGIRFDRNLSWISFSDTRAARRMVQEIENRASATRLPTVLRRLADGATITFGNARLNRQFVANGRNRVDWIQVADVHVKDRILGLLGRDDRELADSIENAVRCLAATPNGCDLRR